MIRAGERYAAEFNLDHLDRSQVAEDRDAERPEVPEVEEVPAYFKRRSAGVWTCIATLAVAFAVAMAYGYSVLKQEGQQLEQIPVMAKSLPAIAQHVANVEGRLVDARADQQHLALQVQDTYAASIAALDKTRQQSEKQMSSAKRALLQVLNQQASAFEGQLSRLQSERDADRLRLAQVEEQLSEARHELASARENDASQLAAIRAQQGEENRQLALISESLPTRQVTFQGQKHQAAEVVPGVTFQLTKTDVRRQRFDGIITSTASHQAVSVQGRSARSPVMFFPTEQGRVEVMVVTSVSQKGVTGYILVPAGKGTGSATDFVSAVDHPVSPRSAPSGLESNLDVP